MEWNNIVYHNNVKKYLTSYCVTLIVLFCQIIHHFLTSFILAPYVYFPVTTLFPHFFYRACACATPKSHLPHVPLDTYDNSFSALFLPYRDDGNKDFTQFLKIFKRSQI